MLVDNQPVDAFRRLAELARAERADIEIEATGGLTLENVAAYATAGADYVSIGALTHSVRAIDIGVDLTPA